MCNSGWGTFVILIHIFKNLSIYKSRWNMLAILLALVLFWFTGRTEEKQLTILGIDLKGCWRQVDNAIDTVSKNKDEQGHFFHWKSRNIFCAICRVWRIVICYYDLTSTVIIRAFFGTLKRLYTEFSGSSQRWNILGKHIVSFITFDFTTLLDTWWEYWLNAIKTSRLN